MMPNDERPPLGKCDQLGIVHAWRVVKSHLMYQMNPPMPHPDHRICQNCGKKQREEVIPEVRKWVDVD